MNRASLTQISNQHRLIDIISNLDSLPATQPLQEVGVDELLYKILYEIELKYNANSINQLKSIIKNAYKNIKKPSRDEILMHAFLDPHFFKNTSKYISCVDILNKIKNSSTIEIYFPIFSRKPFSPFKNNTQFADMAEVGTLLKMGSFANILSILAQNKPKFHILSDGKKYNRACLTPNEIVEKYQNSISFWIKFFKLDDVLFLEDYEDLLLREFGYEFMYCREDLFFETYHEISSKFDVLFKPKNVKITFEKISKNEIGRQLCYTFWSILTSVCYDISKKEYFEFVKSVCSTANLHEEKALKAYEAAKRYVAISLTDRKLDIVKKLNGNAFKFTIHAKKDEFRFIDTNKLTYNLTAQHATGGVKGRDITYDYLINREIRKESPVCISEILDTNINKNLYGYLVEMSSLRQPFYYLAHKEERR